MPRAMLLKSRITEVTVVEQSRPGEELHPPSGGVGVLHRVSIRTEEPIAGTRQDLGDDAPGHALNPVAGVLLEQRDPEAHRDGRRRGSGWLVDGNGAACDAGLLGHADERIGRMMQALVDECNVDTLVAEWELLRIRDIGTSSIPTRRPRPRGRRTAPIEMSETITRAPCRARYSPCLPNPPEAVSTVARGSSASRPTIARRCFSPVGHR